MAFSTKIRDKLTILFLLTGILPILILGVIGYVSYTNTIEEQAFDRLTSVREAKKQAIEAYFLRIRKDIRFFAESNMVIQAINGFTEAFHQLDANHDLERLGKNYVQLELRKYYKDHLFDRLVASEPTKKKAQNYFPTDPKTSLLQYIYFLNREINFCNLGYCQTHSEFHPKLSELRSKSGYYDIFLIDTLGYLVYTSVKEVDFGTNLNEAPYNKTNLAKSYRQAFDKETVSLVDFELYVPSLFYPASFIATPVYDKGQKIGVLVFQIPVNKINETMLVNTNSTLERLDKSSESYLVGSDFQMRSDSRFVSEKISDKKLRKNLQKMNLKEENIEQIVQHHSTILFFEVHTKAVESALKENTGTQVIRDYRKVSVLSSYTPLEIEGLKWVLLSEVDENEAFTDLYTFRNRFLVLIVLTLGVLVGVALWVSKNLSTPILTLTKTMEKVAQGDMEQYVKLDTKDETQKLATTFNHMVTEIRQAQEEIQTQNEELLQQQEELRIQTDHVTQQNEVLHQQKQEMLAQNEELRQQQEELQAQHEHRQKLERENLEVNENRSELEKALDQLRERDNDLTERNQQIAKSIGVAQDIQTAILPTSVEMGICFRNYFSLYLPKDTVSGDFFWVRTYNQKTYLAMVDCTGHGVPGALMSILGYSALNEIVKTQEATSPAQMLVALDRIVRKRLRQQGKGMQHGMDIAICMLERNENQKPKLIFAGAKLGVVVYTKGVITIYKGDRKLIGGNSSNTKEFTNQEVEVRKGTILYLATDGYSDQHNDNRKSFSRRRFYQLLENVADLPFDVQQRKLNIALREYQGTVQQRDDITVLGVKI